MLEKITKGFIYIFAIFWFVVILTEYWRNNPEYGNAIEYFQYSSLLVFFLLLGGLASWGITRVKKHPIRFVNGLTVFIGLLILDIVSLLSFYNKFPSNTPSAPGLFMHLMHLIGVVLAIFSIYLVARVLGEILTFIFPLKIAKSDLPVIQTALGISVMTFLLFFLGVFGGLTTWIVAPLLLLIIAINFRSAIRIIQSTLFKPLELSKDLNALGIFSFLFLGVFLIFDFVHILRPFPTGADAINLYVNLPKLIGNYASLVDGHQPYNWSLFMSYGTVVFQRIDVTLGLSFLGGFLSLGALFQLSRKWLTVNQSALCLLLFGSLPMTNFLWYKDLKIDMGLLFIMLCILLLFYNWVVPPKKEKKKTLIKKKKSTKTKPAKATKTIQTPSWLINTKSFFASRIPSFLKEHRLLIVIGFLAGFAFGIKLTTLFFFFALISAIWYKEAGFLAFLAAFFILFGIAFILKLDEQPQLRNFHNSVSILQWILLIIGVGLFAYLFSKRKKSMIRILNISVLIGLFFLLPVLPWFGKNISETGTISVDALLNGKKATPILNVKELKDLLEK
jgi:hypothetical protein